MPTIELHFGEQDLGKYKIVKPITIIGRDPTADIVIDNLGISRHHCHVEKRGLVYVAKDLDSSNGTFVAGARITEHNLNDGDEITIGKYRLIFHYTESEGAEATSQADTSVAEQETPGAPDEALQTYVMDGKAIRKQLKQMEGEDGAPALGPMSAAEHAAALDPLKPRGLNVTSTYRKQEGTGGGFKALLVMSLILNFILLIVMLLFGAIVFKKFWNQGVPVVESVDGGNKRGEGEAPAASSETDLSDEGILIPGDE